MRTLALFCVTAILAMCLAGCDNSAPVQPPAPDEIMTEDKVIPAFTEEEAKAAEEAATRQ